jgi:kynurenine formamidase
MNRSDLGFPVPFHVDDVPEAELGAGRLVTAESVAAALSLPTTGRVFDLEPGLFPEMPIHPKAPPFQLVTYRTPRGFRIQKDVESFREEINSSGTAWIDEVIIGTAHCGSHIDALSHVTRGVPGEWHGGTVEDDLGDFGPVKADASKIPPIIARGVLIDVAGSLGEPELPEGYKIGANDLERALDQQGTELRKGDVVLVRTGQMRRWPEGIIFSGHAPGVVLDGARALARHSPIALGADTTGFETRPDSNEPNTVHMFLLIEQGIYIMEWLYLEELAEARVYEFLFIALPLKMRGATGSWIRPVCIA